MTAAGLEVRGVLRVLRPVILVAWITLLLVGCGSATTTSVRSAAPVISCLRHSPEARAGTIAVDQDFPGSGPIVKSSRVVTVTFTTVHNDENDFAIVDVEPTIARARRVQRVYPRSLARSIDVKGTVVIVWMTTRTPQKRRTLAACTDTKSDLGSSGHRPPGPPSRTASGERQAE